MGETKLCISFTMGLHWKLVAIELPFSVAIKQHCWRFNLGFQNEAIPRLNGRMGRIFKSTEL